MNAVSIHAFNTSANVFSGALSLDDVRLRAPAVFAPSAHARTSPKYTFIPTERVLSGLMGAGFVPVAARQARTRRASPMHARHVLRLRRRFETVQAQGRDSGNRVPQQPRRHERVSAPHGRVPRCVSEWPHRLAGCVPGVSRLAPRRRRR